MDKLSYGSFADTLLKYIQPEISNKDLGNILLISPITGDAKEQEREFVRKAHLIDDQTVSRIRHANRDIPGRIRNYYKGPNTLTCVKNSFTLDVVPRIHNGAKEDLLNDILSIIEQDNELTQDEKSYLRNLAKVDKLCDFLAETYMRAIHRKPDVQQVENLPRQNHWFYGREELLGDIRHNYRNGTHVQGLFGMGGVGKTQLALQYAHLYAEDYETIWWFNAETEISIHNSIKKFLSAQKIRPKGNGSDSKQLAFLNYCNKHSGWLFIYDNAEYETEEEYQTLLEYFPKNPLNGDILLTTRCKSPFENAVQLEIPVFDINTATDFLQHRSERGEDPEAEKLADRLGCLPLALEYAAAYIRETPGVDYAAYHKKLERYSVRVLDKKVGQLSYKMTVREAFHVTLDKLSVNPDSKSVLQFLNICAYLAPDNIEINVFVKFGESLPEPIRNTLRNELDRDELIRKLTKYSLVQSDGESLNIHRLLQEVLRDEIHPENEIDWIKYGLDTYANFKNPIKMLPNDFTIPLLASSIPHVQMLLHWYVHFFSTKSRMKTADIDFISREYFYWTGCSLSDMGSLRLNRDMLIQDAIKDLPNIQKMVDFFNELPNDNNIYLAWALLLLGISYWSSKDYQTAFNHFLKSAKIANTVVDTLSSHTDFYMVEAAELVIVICQNIGYSAVAKGNSALAWSCFLCLLKSLRAVLKYPYVDLVNDTIHALRNLSVYIASFTRRAFAIQLEMPKWYYPANDTFDAFAPFTHTVFLFCLPVLEADIPIGDVDGFDLLLENCKGEKSARILNKSWTTLAFSEGVNTEEKMLELLESIDVKRLNTSAKRSLYGAIYVLAKLLHDDEHMHQYENKLKRLANH